MLQKIVCGFHKVPQNQLVRKDRRFTSSIANYLMNYEHGICIIKTLKLINRHLGLNICYLTKIIVIFFNSDRNRSQIS